MKTETFGAGQKASAGPLETPPDAAAKAPAEADAKPPADAAVEAPPAAADGAAAAPAVSVTFKKSNKTASLPPAKSILEASEDVGVNIPFECRVVTCGTCKTQLLSGTATNGGREWLWILKKRKTASFSSAGKA